MGEESEALMAGRFFFFLYRSLWEIFALIVPALLIWRSYKGKEDSTRLHERYGISKIPRPQNIQRLYWLHGVSVGESVSSLVLGIAILKAEPNSHILITSNTLTSQHMLRNRIKELELESKISIQTQPYDKSKWVNRFLSHWKPDVAVMMESEVWPNLVTLSFHHHIPVLMASAQISDKSIKKWDGFGRYLAEVVFQSFSAIVTIDQDQADRFSKLIPHQKITVGGSMKAAAPQLPINGEMVDEITKGAAGRTIILLASSHETEEVLFVDAFEAINQSGAYLGIIAPRHINRTGIIEGLLNDANITHSKRSSGRFPDQKTKIWIADAMGEMGSLIKAADLIVLGGGFAKLGGHNPMEMAALGKGVISGPHVFKNTKIFETLLDNRGCIFVDTASALADTLTSLNTSTTQLNGLNHGAVLAYNKLTDAADQTARLVMKAASKD